jgi:hypothetical protein
VRLLPIGSLRRGERFADTSMQNGIPALDASLSRQVSANEGNSLGSSKSQGKRVLVYFAVIVLVLLIHAYPALRARSELQSTTLPPMFAPDLSLYLNLSDSRTNAGFQFLNPFYLVRVPPNGTGFLQFRLGPALFGGPHSAWESALALCVPVELVVVGLAEHICCLAISAVLARSVLKSGGPGPNVADAV